MTQPLLALVAIASLAWPAYHYGRARAVFWRDHSRKAYVRQYAAELDRLAAAGRVQDALRIAGTAYRGLGSAPEGRSLRARLFALEARVRRSDALAANATIIEARVWNPVSAPQRFFELAEAVRLNPQSYAAAEPLLLMTTKLRERSIPADQQALCQAAAAPTALRTMSRLEAEIRFAAALPRARCVESVETRWSLGTVDCIIAISAAVRRSEGTIDFRTNRPNECAGLILTDDERASDVGDDSYTEGQP